MKESLEKNFRSNYKLYGDNMDFTEMLKQLPQRPGIYMMINSLGNIIYVGKAKNLKTRVSQYFKNQKDRSPKVVEMINNIHTVKYIVTDTELDAFIEECRLIKEIKPWYNKQMKNNKKYIYIKIPDEPYPKIAIVNKKVDDNALYFGPFTSLHRVESTVQYLNEFYPIRKCTTPGLVKRVNGCLFGQLGTCLAACTGRVSHVEYKEYIENICHILNGKYLSVVHELLKKQDLAVEKFKFEKAAQYREYYLGLRHVIGKQQLIQSSNKNRNIAAVEFIDDMHAKLFLIKGNKLLYREVLSLETIDVSAVVQKLKQIFIDEFMQEKSFTYGLTQQDIDEAQIIYSYLKKNKRIISFWIPSTRLDREASGLDATVMKIINRITSGNLSDSAVNKMTEN